MDNMKTVLFILGLLWAAATPALDTGADGIDHAVWSALINHGLDGDVPIIVIAADTTGDPVAIGAAEDAPAVVMELGAPAETLDHWVVRNRRSRQINTTLDVAASYQLLSADTRAELFADVAPDVGWTAFFSRYPGAPGLLRLSLAGFDAALDDALVYVEYQCGPGCGSGRLIYLAKAAAGEWQVVNAALVWMVE